MKFFVIITLNLFMMSTMALAGEYSGVRIKELCRLSDSRDNALVGYGIVTGLAGTGDSSRSKAGLQSISNILKRFDVNITPNQLRARNSAIVMISATLRPYSRTGDKIDVNVTSIGDARSLVGGTLMLSSLTGPDDKVYALAQGPVSVGGYSYDLNGNMIQKNHPTSANIPDGAIIEKSVDTEILNSNGDIEFVLHNPDFTTADRIVGALNSEFESDIANAIDAGRIQIRVPGKYNNNLVRFITKLEKVKVRPDNSPRVVINERTGTIVSGGNVILANVSITHGDLKVAISTENIVSQPVFVRQIASDGIKTEVVPKTTIDVDEAGSVSVSMPKGTSINDLVMALNKLNATSRDIITIIQAIKRAGALHAELIIQ